MKEQHNAPMSAVRMNSGSPDELGRLRDRRRMRRRKRCQETPDGFILCCSSPFDQKEKPALEKGEKSGMERV